jgi:recombination protein RecA
MGDQHVGLQARLMSKAMRKLTGVVRNSKTCLIFTNQLREKIGVMFGSPETTPGGRALKYHASVRIDLRRIGSIKEGETVVGNRVRAKVVKNKIAPPFRQTEFDIYFDRGICRAGDLIDLGVNTGVIAKQGTWLSHGKLRLGQGRDRARAFLQENADVVKALTDEVKAAIGVGSATPLPRANGGTVSDEAEPAETRAE